MDNHNSNSKDCWTLNKQIFVDDKGHRIGNSRVIYLIFLMVIMILWAALRSIIQQSFYLRLPRQRCATLLDLFLKRTAGPDNIFFSLLGHLIQNICFSLTLNQSFQPRFLFRNKKMCQCLGSGMDLMLKAIVLCRFCQSF